MTIPLFINIPPAELTDNMNELIIQINEILDNAATGAAITFLMAYPVASLPAGLTGAVAYATNGLKIGEASGSGTGVPIYFSLGAWRVFSDDSPVQV